MLIFFVRIVISLSKSVFFVENKILSCIPLPMILVVFEPKSIHSLNCIKLTAVSTNMCSADLTSFVGLYDICIFLSSLTSFVHLSAIRLILCGAIYNFILCRSNCKMPILSPSTKPKCRMWAHLNKPHVQKSKSAYIIL